MGALTGFGDSAREERVTIHGPHPISLWMGRAIDGLRGRGLNGADGVIFGEPSEPAMRYFGDLGPQHDFAGAGRLALDRGQVPGFNRAMPATQGPVSSPLVDLLMQEPWE